MAKFQYELMPNYIFDEGSNAPEIPARLSYEYSSYSRAGFLELQVNIRGWKTIAWVNCDGVVGIPNLPEEFEVVEWLRGCYDNCGERDNPARGESSQVERGAIASSECIIEADAPEEDG